MVLREREGKREWGPDFVRENYFSGELVFDYQGLLGAHTHTMLHTDEI